MNGEASLGLPRGPRRCGRAAAHGPAPCRTPRPCGRGQRSAAGGCPAAAR